MSIKFDRPTIKSDEIFMWLMPNMNYYYKLDVVHNSTTTTISNDRIIHVDMERIGTYGVGSFDIIILNADGLFNETINDEDIINFYVDVDNSSPSTKRYSGIIKTIQNKYGKYGVYLRIRGLYISHEMLSSYVTKSYYKTNGHVIIRELFEEYLPDYTTSNITETSSVLTVEWKKVPLIDCIKEVCIGTSCDFYITPDIDVRYFPSNSILNEREAAVYGQNIYPSDNFGIGDDSVDKKTRIKLIGSDIDGLPIIHQNIDEVTDNLEIVIKDNSITTLSQAREKVEYEYNNKHESKFRGSLMCLGLLTINPGEKMWVSMPEQKIHAIYKVIAFRHIIRNGYFMTIPTFQEISSSITRTITDLIIKDDRTTNDKNPNDMKFSRFFEFNDSSDTSSISYLTISNGKLSITSGNSTGIFISISDTTEDSNNVSQVEMRIVGNQLLSSLFYIRFEDGYEFEQITPSFDTYTGIAYIPINTGKNISIKVQLIATSENTNPEINTIALYYK